MQPPESVAVVVAWDGPPRSPDATLARFASEAGPRGEVIVVDASRDGSAAAFAARFANVRHLRRPAGRLVPVLWRDGLLIADAPLVAFSTARMLPKPGWLASLADRLRETGAAGVGGPIEAGGRLTATDRAVALLRYSNYFPPLPDADRAEPPGENALYRRDRLFEIESSWLGGFWEAEVHRALRDRGYVLTMSDRAIATFEGGVGLIAMIGQRLAHARKYGEGRSAGLSLGGRLARVASAPLVPPLLCARIAARLRSRGMGLGPWLASAPSLMAMATAWAVGEAAGTLLGSLAVGPSARPKIRPTPVSHSIERTPDAVLRPTGKA